MEICKQCQIRDIGHPFKGYNENVCWICFLKNKKYYKSAIKEIKDGWFDWSTNILKYKIGWSFAETMTFQLLFMTVLKSKNLNKTPKIPENMGLKDLGYSQWQIQTAKAYYSDYEL